MSSASTPPPFDADLLRFIPPDAGVVVEAGCGVGLLGAHYKRINPHGRYFGLEPDLEAARQAAGQIDGVVVGPPEAQTPELLGLAAGSVDCLVLGDLLARLADPWTALTRLAGWLRPGGQAIAVVPNAQHWAVLAGLIRGRWQDPDDGPQVRGWLRSFTRDGVVAAFARAGLLVHDVKIRWVHAPEYDRFVAAMGPAVQALGVDPRAFAEQTAAGQYLVRAVRTDQSPRRLLIQTVVGEAAVCYRVRVQEPDAFLTTIPGVRTVAAVDPDALGAPGPGEAVVYVRQRTFLCHPEHLAMQRRLVRLGYLLISEFDDDPFLFPAAGALDALTFRGCHAIQTSTPLLAETLREFNPNIAVFPNQLAWLPPPKPPRGDGGPVRLFFGALNREPDWAPLMPALNRVLAAHGAGVAVRVVHDRAFFDALATEHKDFQPLCGFDVYQEILRSCDVALLPLNPTRFNRHKSDLKFLECAAHGVVALASPVVYGSTIRHRETGVIFGSVGEFEESLHELIADAPFRQRLASAAYQEVAAHRLLAQHYRSRYDWYVGLLDRLPELNRGLRDRVPALFEGD